MKKLLLALMMIVVTSCVGCQNGKMPFNYDYVDSAKVSEMIAEVMDANVTTFTTVEDVTYYLQSIQLQKELDSTLASLSKKQISDIFSVLKFTKPNAKYTIDDLVSEYNKNKQVYDGLPAENTTSTTSATEPPTNTTSSTQSDTVSKNKNTVPSSSDVIDTIIDGHRALIFKK
jgi:hypothetical protein